MERKQIIGVIGSGRATPEGYAAAREIGRLIAEAGAVLVCGGLGGVMEAASRGCTETGGLVVGILPGAEAEEANAYVGLPIPTNMGHARNIVIAHTARTLIAVEGEYGTLSEVAIALKMGRQVIALDHRFSFEGVIVVPTPREAVRLALAGVRASQPEAR